MPRNAWRALRLFSRRISDRLISRRFGRCRILRFAQGTGNRHLPNRHFGLQPCHANTAEPKTVDLYPSVDADNGEAASDHNHECRTMKLCISATDLPWHRYQRQAQAVCFVVSDRGDEFAASKRQTTNPSPQSVVFNYNYSIMLIRPLRHVSQRFASSHTTQETTNRQREATSMPASASQPATF